MLFFTIVPPPKKNTFGTERQNNLLQEPFSFEPHFDKEYSSHREDRVYVCGVCVRYVVCDVCVCVVCM
jgi:hypothetical protein